MSDPTPPSPPPSERPSRAPHVPPVVQAIDHLGEIIAVLVAGYLCLRGKMTSETWIACSLAFLGVQTGLRQLGGRRGPPPSGLSGLLGLIWLGSTGAHLAARLTSLVVVSVLASVALSGCPLPPPDGCTPHAYVCREDPNAPGAALRPAVCSPSQRWAWTTAPCPEGTVCRTDLPSTLGATTVAGCAPPADGGL